MKTAKFCGFREFLGFVPRVLKSLKFFPFQKKTFGAAATNSTKPLA